MKPQRIGEILVQQGVLSQQQVDQLIDQQQQTGRPLGWLAEQQFGIDPTVIEEAWAEQYAGLARTIDHSRGDSRSSTFPPLGSGHRW